jgi:hypothetical protein
MNCTILTGRPTEAVKPRYGGWVVTDSGLEHTGFPEYDIPRSRLGEDWVRHMAEKTWVNTSDFGRALDAARAYHL